MRDYAKKIRNERDNYTPGPENDIPLELQTTLNGFRFLQYDSGLTSGSRTKPLTLGISEIKILNLHFLLFLKGIPYFIRWRVFGSKKFDEKPETRQWRVSDITMLSSEMEYRSQYSKLPIRQFDLHNLKTINPKNAILRSGKLNLECCAYLFTKYPELWKDHRDNNTMSALQTSMLYSSPSLKREG
ncbi:hypothetical protein GJ496_009741 [Pomphorhynchus laevis]|nr:hypothetical protein GJ496_009741 [Pomphorhynchus laevis]